MHSYFPKITVITPSYNQANYIEQTIKLVIEQNYPNLEYFIFDGGSTDSTVSIIKKYEDKIAYWESTKDKGQSEAINKGIKKSTGDLIVWLNSDDYYETDALQTIATFYTNVHHCYIGVIRYFHTNGAYYYSQCPIFRSTSKTAGYGRTPQPAMFFSREAYQYLGLLNENLNYCMDLEWWIKYLLIYGISNIRQLDKVLVNFRLHTQSKTISQVSGFERERDSIYYSISKQLGMQKQAQAIEALGNVLHSYSFEFIENMDLKVAERMIHYFLLLRGDEFYVAHKKSKAELCLSCVDSKFISTSDNYYYFKLRFKNKFLPSSVINFLRNQ